MALPLLEKSSNSSLKGQFAEKSRFKSSTLDHDPTQYDFPQNFGEVVKGIYRSSFPHAWHLPALRKLGLKTIITLVEEPFTTAHSNFLTENGIAHHRILIQANKDPAVKTPDHIIVKVLEILLNKANHPVLVHCNKGKHRTGCIVGCFRKLQNWDIDDVITEYLNYSFPKSRPLDEKFIRSFDESQLAYLAQISDVASWQVPTNPKFLIEPKELEHSPKRRIHSSLSELSMPDYD
ncbi:hypothetical protein MW887_010507 [Aspergillus wentii]|nr:hypothetical protein MW887_010507 [Aspergillus wentii]